MSSNASSSVRREIEYLKKETQRCAQVGAEASLLKEESGQLQEQVMECCVDSRFTTVDGRMHQHVVAEKLLLLTCRGRHSAY